MITRNRKLTLHSQTLRNLSRRQMQQVEGAVMYTGCDSACTQCPGGGLLAKLAQRLTGGRERH